MSDNLVKVETHQVETLRNDLHNYEEVVEAAKTATNVQKTMTLKEALRSYPQAAAWSILLSTAM